MPFHLIIVNAVVSQSLVLGDGSSDASRAGVFAGALIRGVVSLSSISASLPFESALLCTWPPSLSIVSCPYVVPNGTDDGTARGEFDFSGRCLDILLPKEPATALVGLRPRRFLICLSVDESASSNSWPDA